MGTPALLRSTWRLGRVTLVGAVAALSAAIATSEVWGHAVDGQVGGRPPSPAAGVAAAVLLVLGDVGIVLAAVGAAERWPMVGRRRLRRLGRHAVVAVATSLLVATAAAGAHALVPWTGHAFAPAAALQHLPGYVVVLVFTHVLLLGRRLTRVRAARLRLGQSLARAGRTQAAAELRAVKAELHPALVTGALDTARRLVRDDPAAAERVVVSLGALMREAVAAAEVDEVTLGEELDGALERAGVAGDDALDPPAPFAVDVDPDARALLVPHLVLPALLACAADAGADGHALTVRAHTVRPHVGRGTRGEERLVLTVVGRGDPGLRVGRGARAGTRGGAGALALRRRLEHMYGASAQLTVAGAGAAAVSAARLVLPARREDDAEPIPPAVPMTVPGTIAWASADRQGQALEAWVTDAAVASGRPARRPAAVETWLVATLVVVAATVVQWQDVAAAHGMGWAAAPVLLMVGVYGASVAGVAAAAVVTTRRWPIGADERMGAAVRAHLTAGVLAAILATAARAAAGRAARGPAFGSWRTLTPGAALVRLTAVAVLYAAFAGVAHVIELGRERRRSARVVAQLRAARAAQTRDRVASELRALKAELNPHFVGNALHTAAALVRRDPDAAGHLLGALGNLARAAGDHLDTQEVPLAEEILGLEPFLSLERARLGVAGGTLTVTWDVAPDVLDAAVPHLVLQPLAENAVRHGLAPRGGTGRLTVVARRAGDRVELTVVDDGVGPGARAADRVAGAVTGGLGTGAGLGGVRRRLALLYGDDAGCVLERGPEGGAMVCLAFPYRPTGAPGETVESLAAAGG